MNKKVVSFFMAEKELLWKSDWYMKKIYKNRIKTNLEGEREAIIFLVDKMWEMFFSKKLNKEYTDKLLFWFELLVWKKEVKEAIENNVSYRKSNLR